MAIFPGILGTEFLFLRSFSFCPRRKGTEGTEGIPGNSFEKERNCEGLLFDMSPILEGKEQGKEGKGRELKERLTLRCPLTLNVY